MFVALLIEVILSQGSRYFYELKVTLAVRTDARKFSVTDSSFTGRVWKGGAPVSLAMGAQ